MSCCSVAVGSFVDNLWMLFTLKIVSPYELIAQQFGQRRQRCETAAVADANSVACLLLLLLCMLQHQIVRPRNGVQSPVNIVGNRLARRHHGGGMCCQQRKRCIPLLTICWQFPIFDFGSLPSSRLRRKTVHKIFRTVFARETIPVYFFYFFSSFVLLKRSDRGLLECWCCTTDVARVSNYQIIWTLHAYAIFYKRSNFHCGNKRICMIHPKHLVGLILWEKILHYIHSWCH